MTDTEANAAALLRMNEQWGPEGYEITFTPYVDADEMKWHATYPPTGDQWHAHTSQRLHMALYAHWSKPMELPDLPASEAFQLPSAN